MDNDGRYWVFGGHDQPWQMIQAIVIGDLRMISNDESEALSHGTDPKHGPPLQWRFVFVSAALLAASPEPRALESTRTPPSVLGGLYISFQLLRSVSGTFLHSILYFSISKINVILGTIIMTFMSIFLLPQVL